MSEIRTFVLEGGWDYQHVPDYELWEIVDGKTTQMIDGGLGLRRRGIIRRLDKKFPKFMWIRKVDRNSDNTLYTYKRRKVIK